MKIKQFPEDFVVDEISSIRPRKKGPYSLYLLTKKNMDFLTAKKEITKKMKSRDERISFAGIKDRRAVTTQYITIKGKYGDKIDFKTNEISLKNLGYTNKKLETGDLEGNKFTITLRDLSENEITKIKNNVERIKEQGFPNYFDSQRFGEKLTQEGFIAKHLMRENFEIALNLYFLPSDKTSPKKQKVNSTITKNWGKWKKILNSIKSLSGVENERKIITHLTKKPDDFLGAFKLIDLRIREILMASYQSYLWNKCVSEFIKLNVKETKEVKYAAGKVNFPTSEETNSLNKTKIPMIDKKLKFENEDVNNIMQKILKKEKLTQDKLKIKKMGNIFFKSRDRPIILHPKDLKIIKKEEDKANKNKKSITLQFKLQKGAYATMLLKALEL
jgi:tRNA pseudouridine13 synthase